MVNFKLTCLKVHYGRNKSVWCFALKSKPSCTNKWQVQLTLLVGNFEVSDLLIVSGGQNLNQGVLICAQALESKQVLKIKKARSSMSTGYIQCVLAERAAVSKFTPCFYRIFNILLPHDLNTELRKNQICCTCTSVLRAHDQVMHSDL